MEAQYNTVHFIKIQCITHNPVFYSLYSFLLQFAGAHSPTTRVTDGKAKSGSFSRLFSAHIFISLQLPINVSKGKKCILSTLLYQAGSSRIISVAKVQRKSFCNLHASMASFL